MASAATVFAVTAVSGVGFQWGSWLLGLGMGGALAVLLAPRWKQLSQRWSHSQPVPSVRQLLSWMDASPAGWILLDRGGRMRHITPKSERILDLNAGRMLVGRSFEDLCSDPNLIGSIAAARIDPSAWPGVAATKISMCWWCPAPMAGSGCSSKAAGP